MGILNVTPDSFSDGGRFDQIDEAIKRAEQMVAEGVDVIDIGGESTRPGGKPVETAIEIARTAPVVEALARHFDIPISIDTTKPAVARANIDAGAEIINDISGLRWAPELAAISAAVGAGLVIMHSRGSFETMHSEPAVEDIVSEVVVTLRNAVETAKAAGIADSQIVLDIGLGFGKTREQNFELIAKIGELGLELPILVGASRKSFLGRLTGIDDPAGRLSASIAAAVLAVANGAKIVRVHDVRETVQALKVAEAITNAS
jgi:dihydropteroate synthase